MLLVDPASTSRCQHELVTGHFLTEDATVILSFTWTPGVELTGEPSCSGQRSMAGERYHSSEGTIMMHGRHRWRATAKGGNSAASPWKHNLFLQSELVSQPCLHLYRTFTQPIAWNRLISQHQRSQNCTSGMTTFLFSRCSGDFAFHQFFQCWKTGKTTFTGLNTSC